MLSEIGSEEGPTQTHLEQTLLSPSGAEQAPEPGLPSADPSCPTAGCSSMPVIPVEPQPC